MLFQRAFAKINLGLRILGRRPDGYHNIETIFHRIDLFDDVYVGDAPKTDVECSESSLSGQGNLSFSAVSSMAALTGIERGVKVYIRKRIPAGAGLGGGSADAAATLRLLDVLWKLDLPDSELRELALSLGSDVPYFLGDRSAHATSRGEELAFFRLSLPYTILVIFPGIPVSTADAYAAVRIRKHEHPGNLRSLLEDQIKDGDLTGGLLTNDFEEYVFDTYPEIAGIRDELLSAGATSSLLSGSGSSVFGLFGDESLAHAAKRRFQDRYQASVTPAGFAPSLDIGEREID